MLCSELSVIAQVLFFQLLPQRALLVEGVRIHLFERTVEVVIGEAGIVAPIFGQVADRLVEFVPAIEHVADEDVRCVLGNAAQMFKHGAVRTQRQELPRIAFRSLRESARELKPAPPFPKN